MPLKTRITDVRHDAETGCFHAHVTLIDGTDHYTYSVDHAAPIDTEISQVSAGLTAAARRMHAPDTCTLTRSRATETPDVAAHVFQRQPNYLGQIIDRLCA